MSPPDPPRRPSPSDPWTIGPYRVVGPFRPGSYSRYLAERDGGEFILRVFDPLGAEASAELARAVAALRSPGSPHIVEFTDSDVTGSPSYIAMRSIPGRKLADIVETSGPLPVEQLMPLVRGTAEAMAVMHRAGVTHRAIHPHNILVEDGQPVLIDLGLPWDSYAEQPASTPFVFEFPHPGYLPPELIETAYEEHGEQGLPAGPPADVFSWAVTIAYAAMGHIPFPGLGYDNIHRARTEEPDLAGIPGPLAEWLRRALAEDPSDRPTARELASFAQRLVLSPDPVPGPPFDPNPLLKREEPGGSAQAAPAAHYGAAPTRPSMVLPGCTVAVAVVFLAAVLGWLVVGVGGRAEWLALVAGPLTVVAVLMALMRLLRPWTRMIKLARARNQLARGRYQRAETLVGGLLDAADTQRGRVIAHAVLASALRGQGRLAEAEEAYAQAQFLSQWAPDLDSAMLSRLDANLGVVRYELGVPGSTAADLRRIYDHAAHRHGTQHTETAMARGDLAVALRDEATATRDEAHLREAEIHASAALGPARKLKDIDDAAMPVLQANLAAILRERGDSAAALEHLFRAEIVARRALGRRHPETLTIRASSTPRPKANGPRTCSPTGCRRTGPSRRRTVPYRTGHCPNRCRSRWSRAAAPPASPGG
jgi:hypothetical protein